MKSRNDWYQLRHRENQDDEQDRLRRNIMLDNERLLTSVDGCQIKWVERGYTRELSECE